MSDIDRIIGSLEEFKKIQLDHNKLNRVEHKEMMKEIARIQKWQWKVEGMRLSIVGALAGSMGAMIHKIAKFL